jgi:hypothetical protein
LDRPCAALTWLAWLGVYQANLHKFPRWEPRSAFKSIAKKDG